MRVTSLLWNFRTCIRSSFAHNCCLIQISLQGGWFDDFLSHMMCCCCALVQEWREVEIRGNHYPHCPKCPSRQLIKSFDLFHDEIMITIPHNLYLQVHRKSRPALPHTKRCINGMNEVEMVSEIEWKLQPRIVCSVEYHTMLLYGLTWSSNLFHCKTLVGL